MSIKMSLVAILVFFHSFVALAAVTDCPERYPNGNVLTYNDGRMYYPNGNVLRYGDTRMYYENGNVLRYGDGRMYYQNGNTLKYSDMRMYYENGNILRYSDGRLFEANGNLTSLKSISLSTAFGNSKMKIVAKSDYDRYQMSIPFGEGIVVLDLDENGNVTCTVEGAIGPSEFKVIGKLGTAYVTVNNEQDSRKMKEAIEQVLNGN